MPPIKTEQLQSVWRKHGKANVLESKNFASEIIHGGVIMRISDNSQTKTDPDTWDYTEDRQEVLDLAFYFFSMSIKHSGARKTLRDRNRLSCAEGRQSSRVWTLLCREYLLIRRLKLYPGLASDLDSILDVY